jgi:hypothetical protein
LKVSEHRFGSRHDLSSDQTQLYADILRDLPDAARIDRGFQGRAAPLAGPRSTPPRTYPASRTD